jgi:uncharacterized protein YabN with tetrapyrrole methylase and pyrophosphatase domain
LPSGSLIVVGTGIQLAVHLTPSARAAIERADELLYLVADPVTRSWIEELNPNASSLERFYAPGRPRAETYAAMVDEILSRVRLGLNVCAAFYGHPGVFVAPSHEAIRRAREEGFQATMQPGISAEDCLFADLGIDPGEEGCQSYEATAFLIHEYSVEPSATLILWQVGVVGQLAAGPAGSEGIPALVEHLRTYYPAEHEVIVYEASRYVVLPPIVRRVPLSELAQIDTPPLSTLVVPPREKPRPNVTMFDRLGLPQP